METAVGKVWARSGMQVSGRSSRVIESYLGALLSSTVQVEGMLVGGRSGWVMGKYSGGLLSSAVPEGCPR